MARLTQPHDKFLKALLDDPAALSALLRERLPAPLVALLADEPPEPIDGVFVDDALRESRSDRLYRLKLKGAGALFVYCLIEHKSRAEDRAGLQVLGYMVSQWERVDVGAGEKLPPILPLVVYHGPTPSRVPRYFSELVAPHATSMGAQPLDFEIVLVDLGAIEDDELSREPTLRAGLLTLKYATRETLQAARLGRVFQAIARAPRLLRLALVYMMETYRGVDRAQLLGEASRVMPEEDVMTVAQELRDEGRQEGRQEGLAEGEARGRVEAQRATLLRVLVRRFGAVPDETRSQVMLAASSELEGWLDRALDATTLEAVFAATH